MGQVALCFELKKEMKIQACRKRRSTVEPRSDFSVSCSCTRHVDATMSGVLRFIGSQYLKYRKAPKIGKVREAKSGSEGWSFVLGPSPPLYGLVCRASVALTAVYANYSSCEMKCT